MSACALSACAMSGCALWGCPVGGPSQCERPCGVAPCRAMCCAMCCAMSTLRCCAMSFSAMSGARANRPRTGKPLLERAGQAGFEHLCSARSLCSGRAESRAMADHLGSTRIAPDNRAQHLIRGRSMQSSRKKASAKEVECTTVSAIRNSGGQCYGTVVWIGQHSSDQFRFD